MKDEPAATRLTTRSATAGWAAWIMLLCAAAWSCSDRSTDHPAATYDETTGRLRSLAFDVNTKGKNDAVLYTDGARKRIELDLSGNG